MADFEHPYCIEKGCDDCHFPELNEARGKAIEIVRATHEEALKWFLEKHPGAKGLSPEVCLAQALADGFMLAAITLLVTAGVEEEDLLNAVQDHLKDAREAIREEVHELANTN